MEKMDYSPVIKALKKADQDFTEKNGVTHYSLFDAALEKAAETFNRENGTTSIQLKRGTNILNCVKRSQTLLLWSRLR